MISTWMALALLLATGEERACKPAKAVELVVGTEFNCARLDDGSVRCWGGVMGWAWDTNVGWSAPHEIKELAGTSRIQQSASGVVCGLAADGTIKCWDLRGPPPKHLAADMKSAFWIDPAGHAAKFGKVTEFWFADGKFARRTDGTILRWDRGTPGPFEKRRLGSRKPATGTGRVSPVPLLRGAIRLSGDDRWGCAWMKDGKARCWGSGPGSFRAYVPPDYLASTIASQLDGVQDLVNCRLGWLCALLGDGTVRAWRDYYVGPSRREITETSPPDLGKVEQIAWGGTNRACFVAEGRVKCWADSDPAPSEILGLDDVVRVGFANEHACALIRDGTVRCWGENNLGQLGDGTTDPRAGMVTVNWCPSSEQPIEYTAPAGVERLVRLERDGASAGCASHNISVYADGTVIYHGKRGVKMRSARRKQIAREKVAELRALLETTPFPAIDWEWQKRFVGSFSDHGQRDTATVEYAQGGERHRVLYSYTQCSVPPEVLRFGERVEEIVGAAEWTGGVSLECALWRAKWACQPESVDAGAPISQ